MKHSRPPWRVRYDRFGRAQFVLGPEYVQASRELDRIRAEHDAALRNSPRPVSEELFSGPQVPKSVRDSLHAVAYTPGATGDLRRSANARLISAAPELLEAARRAYSRLRRADSDGDSIGESALLKMLAQAISKAAGEDLNANTLVDDRAPLHLWAGDRHLRRTQRRYRCRACNREVNTLHDSACDWLPVGVQRCRRLWPEAYSGSE